MSKKNKLPPKTTAPAKAEPSKSKSAKVTAKAAAVAPAATKSSPAAKPKVAASPKAKSAAPATPAKTGDKPVAAAVKAPTAHAAPAGKPTAATLKAPEKPTASAAAPAPARAMPAAGNAKPAEKLTAAATAKPAAAKEAPAEPKKPVTTRHGFKTNELIVYPAHGVGRIIGIEEQEIAGISLELFVIEFEKDKMTLRVPTSKLASVGMRKLAEDGVLKKAMETLKGKARIKRTMWSRRAQEYEAKINSGDLIAIAEVVRDLYRSEAQPEQSYSERQLYEAALDRMSRELAAVDRSDERTAMQRITEVLSKSARGRRAADDAEPVVEAGEVKAA